MPIKIYNSLTRKKDAFKPKGKTVKMYVCGPTVYDLSHIGHARTYVSFDVIRRYLESYGYTVKYIVNITDVEDKIIKRSAEVGSKPEILAREIEATFFEDMDHLNVKKASFNPRVTETIREIIEFIQKLIKKNFAYVVDGDVYFDVSKFKTYGKLSGNKEEALKAGARVEPDPRKRNPADFALWKSAKQGEPHWDSPWSFGRPGWHIECSAMINKMLGSQIDIHGGGMDLKFPHHENEIAQSEALSGKPLANTWIHTGFLTVNGEKMSKSLGNFVTIRDMLQKISPYTLRLFLLKTEYRSPLDFSDENINHATATQSNLQDFYDKISYFSRFAKKGKPSAKTKTAINKARKEFEKSMNDDFNTSLALAAIFDFIRDSNKLVDTGTLSGQDFALIKEFADEFNGVFGILEETDQPSLVEISELLLKREELRKKKIFAEADEIRNKLRAKGWEIEDTPYGPRPKKTK